MKGTRLIAQGALGRAHLAGHKAHCARRKTHFARSKAYVAALSLGLVLAAGCSRVVPAPTSPAPPAPAQPLLCVTAAVLESPTVALRGGSTRLTVTTTRPDCGWHVSAPEWVTYSGPSSGVGDGSIVLKAPKATEPRSAQLIIGGTSTQWTQQAAPLSITATCRTAQIGAFGGPCNAVVERAEEPQSGALEVMADLAQFGAPYRDDWDLVYCGCGAWDMDLRIREPFEPGTYIIRFHVRDEQGRTATTTAPLIVTR